MTKLFIQKIGTSIILGIIGTSTEAIIERYYSFWNHQATSEELEWKNPDFAYFWTTTDKLKRALIRASLAEILNRKSRKFKGIKGGALALAREQGKKKFDNIESAQIIQVKHGAANDKYNLGEIENVFVKFTDDGEVQMVEERELVA